jgi:hypothetical protein
MTDFINQGREAKAIDFLISMTDVSNWVDEAENLTDAADVNEELRIALRRKGSRDALLRRLADLDDDTQRTFMSIMWIAGMPNRDDYATEYDNFFAVMGVIYFWQGDWEAMRSSLMLVSKGHRLAELVLRNAATGVDGRMHQQVFRQITVSECLEFVG